MTDEQPTLDDAQVEAKILEVAKLHKPLCEKFTGAMQAGGYFDRAFSQGYTVSEDGKVEEEGFADDGDYGANIWTWVCCGECGEELWPNPAEGVLTPIGG